MSAMPMSETPNVPVAKSAPPKKSFGQRLWKSVRDFPMLYLGAFLVLALVFVAVFAPLLAPYDPAKVFNNGLTSQGVPVPPSGQFLFGTDANGRDLLSRLIFGSRVSMVVGLVSAVMNLILGIGVGLAAGFFRGWTDSILMRITDVVLAFPLLLLAMALVAVLGPSELNVLLIIGAVGWGTMARLVRGQVLAIREFEYVQAERALGASSFRIMFRVILPNIFGTVIVFAMLNVGLNILTESALSFLGLGIEPPTPSWGNMIDQGMTTYQIAPWTMLFPGAALALAVLGFNLLGDGLRDVLDPHNTTHG